MFNYYLYSMLGNKKKCLSPLEHARNIGNNYFPVLPDQITSRCGDGWVTGNSGYCYWLSDARLSWSDANKECWKLDSVLLRIYGDNDLVQKF